MRSQSSYEWSPCTCVPFSCERDINVISPQGAQGALARAFADLLKSMAAAEGPSWVRPAALKAVLNVSALNFSDGRQHDSQV
jgi:hypothetical protein